MKTIPMLDKEKIAESKKKNSKKAVDIYKDWCKTRDIAQIKTMKAKLKEAHKSGTKFAELLREMGADGQQIQKIFSDAWMSFGSDPARAKKNFTKILYNSTPTSKSIIEENDGVKLNATEDGSVQKSIEMSYTPVTDRSNQMLSNVTATTRDLVIQIRHAIVAGNMQIAGELIKSGWGSLSLKQRNGLIEWVNAMDPYNKLPDADKVPKNKGTLRIKPLEKRADMTKDDFVGKLLRTAEQYLKIQ